MWFFMAKRLENFATKEQLEKKRVDRRRESSPGEDSLTKNYLSVCKKVKRYIHNMTRAMFMFYY